MTLARSFTNKIKRGLTIRPSSVLETEEAIQKARPTISLPLERLYVIDETKPLSSLIEEFDTSGWSLVNSISPSPTSSAPSSHKSYVSSPTPSRSSSSSATSYNSGEEYFPPSEKKVSFSNDTKIILRHRESCVSVASSVYAAEGELPPPFEDDEEIMQKIGKFRFAAAEYIQEIKGTPMILVDGKLYL